MTEDVEQWKEVARLSAKAASDFSGILNEIIKEASKGVVIPSSTIFNIIANSKDKSCDTE